MKRILCLEWSNMPHKHWICIVTFDPPPTHSLGKSPKEEIIFWMPFQTHKLFVYDQNIRSLLWYDLNTKSLMSWMRVSTWEEKVVGGWKKRQLSWYKTHKAPTPHFKTHTKWSGHVPKCQSWLLSRDCQVACECYIVTASVTWWPPAYWPLL